MSRNGPVGYSTARAQARRPQPDDPYTAPPMGQQGAPQWPPQYPDPQPQQAPRPAFAQHAAPGQQSGYAPQPAYAQPQQAPAPQHVSYGQPQGQGYYFPRGAEAEAPAYGQQAPAHQLPFESVAQAAPSYGQQPQQPQTVPRWPAQTDAHGFDLGSYMPAAAPGFPQPEPAQFHQPQAAAHFHQADPGALSHHADFDPAGLPRQHDPARFDAGQQGYGESDADFDEILAEEEEEPRRSRRGLMIAAALVGAIGLGGALAYTYKTFIASSAGRAPLIKAADFGPNKVKPVVADGKNFPNTDKKLLNRLGDQESSPPARVVIGVPPPAAQEAGDDRASDDPNAPRKVRIIPITPNSPPAGVAPVTTGSAPSKPPMVAVPGVTLENMGVPQVPPSAARAVLPPPQQHAPPVARAAPPAVKVASVAKQPEPPALPAAAAPAAPVKKVTKAPVHKTKTASAEPAAAPATSATSGYVAVLSSKKSRMDALKAFADMQQKYGEVLGSKTPDVQEANLGEKGIWYRAVVGPPGSRDAATSLCSKLKTAGYTGCWVAAY
jgi:sporulation related protein